MRNNKAQMATTMTWAVAGVIVLFLMVIFFVVTATLSGKKLFNKNEISFEERAGNLSSQRELIKILNSPVNIDGTKNIKELINLTSFDKEKYKIVLDEEMKKVLNESEYEYIDSQVNELRIRGFRIFAEGLFDINSEHFSLGSGIKDIYGRGIDLAKVYIPVREGFVYVIIQGSEASKSFFKEEEKENE